MDSYKEPQETVKLSGKHYTIEQLENWTGMRRVYSKGTILRVIKGAMDEWSTGVLSDDEALRLIKDSLDRLSGRG
jgi:hypothetical protein